MIYTCLHTSSVVNTSLDECYIFILNKSSPLRTEIRKCVLHPDCDTFSASAAVTLSHISGRPQNKLVLQPSPKQQMEIFFFSLVKVASNGLSGVTQVPESPRILN